MKLMNMPLLPNESRVIFDWDARTYTIYFKDGSATAFRLAATTCDWPDEFLEWLPEH